MSPPAAAVQPLDPVTIDQIAAGEVVERPASVVKELVENALDSGARSIEVTVHDGGLGSISVADDGSGMAAHDAETAVLRHATSKIRSVADLQAVRTYGFRGEALSSIASISRFVLTTRRPQDEVGFRLELHGGKLVHKGACGCPPGTHLQVGELFYNTPARRKFMRAAVTEQAYVQEALLRCFLGARRAGLIYTAGKRRLLDLPHDVAADQRPLRLLGRRVRTLLPFVGAPGPRQISGHLSPPALARGETQGLFLFVNGRFVRDRMLQRAAIEGYQLAFAGQFPTAVLYIDVPPDGVDVNVHPQKTEVRFDDAQAVFCALREAVALAATRLREQLGKGAEAGGAAEVAAARDGATNAPRWAFSAARAASGQARLPHVDAAPATQQGGAQQAVAAVTAAPTPTALRLAAPCASALATSPHGAAPTDHALTPGRAARASLRAPAAAPLRTRRAAGAALAAGAAGQDAEAGDDPLALPLRQAPWQRLRPLGVGPAGYLACVAEGELHLVALAEAHAAVVRRTFAAGHDVALHRLLLPPRLVADATHAAAIAAFVRSCSEEASGSACGLHLQPVGEGSYLIQAVAACFADCEPLEVARSYFAAHPTGAPLNLDAWLDELQRRNAWPQAFGDGARWPQRLFAALTRHDVAFAPPWVRTLTADQVQKLP